ncbi:MAG: PHP domain-containing protein, partial [Lactococcus plantarum]|nr:PHP domain-containing protein [Lactococcus plantarum]
MYAQLNTKTVFSFMSSTVKLREYLTTAKRLGYQTLGISDVDNLHGAHQFITLARAFSIKPVVSFESTFVIDSLPIQLTFIAKTTKGLSNLYKISSNKNFGHHLFSDIASHLADVAIVVPSDYAVESVLGALPDKDVFVGVLKPSEQQFLRPSIPFVAVKYLAQEDANTLTILQHIKNGTKLDESLTITHTEHLRPEEEIARVFGVASLATLDKLVAEIDYDESSSDVLALPVFNKEEVSSHTLRTIAESFLIAQEKWTDTYQKRLTHELSTIHAMGFDDYFLIVSDVIRYARSENIYTGMGRGSALGSLVAYALQITGVDPVANDLLFERFLNPERASLPDIDIDMPDTKRADILSYVKNKYGSSHVAQIMTFSTFGMKQSFRDVAKVFGMTEVEVSHISGMIGRSDNLAQEYEKNNRFRAEIINDTRLQSIFNYAKKIEGIPRQKSVHASGVVLAAKDLTNYLPLAPGETL